MPSVHLVQLDMPWEDKAASHARVGALLDAAEINAGDLILLPEMFDTGFSLNVSTTADVDRASADFLASLAADTNAYVQGGITVPEPDAGWAKNRSLTFDPTGACIAQYDKIHPFTYGREPECFRPGTDVTTFEWAGLCVCPVICYDLRFPELFRAGLEAGAEMFTVIANWPSPRREHWRTLLHARAIENQAFVAAVNRTGNDPHLPYAGDSLVIDPKGEIVVDADAAEGVVSASIDGAALRDWRAEFPAWKDRRL